MIIESKDFHDERFTKRFREYFIEVGIVGYDEVNK